MRDWQADRQMDGHTLKYKHGHTLKYKEGFK